MSKLGPRYTRGIIAQARHIKPTTRVNHKNCHLDISLEVPVYSK